MNLLNKQLVYRSSLSHDRTVKKKVLQIPEMQNNEVLILVKGSPSRTYGDRTTRVRLRKSFFLQLDRGTGNVYYFRPGDTAQLGPGTNKILVGVRGEFE